MTLIDYMIFQLLWFISSLSFSSFKNFFNDQTTFIVVKYNKIFMITDSQHVSGYNLTIFSLINPTTIIKKKC